CDGGVRLCRVMVTSHRRWPIMVCTMNEQTFPQVPKSLRFSTHGIVPDSRIQMWEGNNAKALIPLDIRTLDNRVLHATATTLHLPSVRMARGLGTLPIA